MSPHVVCGGGCGGGQVAPAWGERGDAPEMLGAQRPWRRLPQAEPRGRKSRRETAWEASTQTKDKQGMCLLRERKGPLSSGPWAPAHPPGPELGSSHICPGQGSPATCDPAAAWAGGRVLTHPRVRPSESSCPFPKRSHAQGGLCLGGGSFSLPLPSALLWSPPFPSFPLEVPDASRGPQG